MEHLDLACEGIETESNQALTAACPFPTEVCVKSGHPCPPRTAWAASAWANGKSCF
jgi:hypothetical protein